MQDNVAIVKELYSAFGRGDAATIQGRMDSDVLWEVEAPAAIGVGGIWHGPEEAMAFFNNMAREHTDIVLEMTDFVADGDRVAAFGRYKATMTSTGKQVDTPVGHYFTFKDGKIVRYVNFTNTGAFLEAMKAEA